MFIGHFALGLAAKRATPRVSLAVLFGAAQLADLVWPVLVVTGLEHVTIDPGNTAFTPLDFISYPYSHSLVFLLVWGAVLGVLYRRLAGASRGAVLLLAALVVSHWALDVLTHRPDMPFYPGGPKIGLGLWNSVPATLTVELAMYGAGLWIYAGATRARDRIGRWAFGSLAVVLVVVYLASLAGPPPPSVSVLAGTAFFGVGLLVLWGGWVDRHRESRFR
jgi:hypothetical protein